MILVAIIVYNRLSNIEKWINCWQKCNKKDALLAIIHNNDTKNDQIPYKELCDKYDILYIPRPNIGLDIGAFQDVCKNRLNLPEFEYLLWCTDDVIPMKRNFLDIYMEKMSRNKVVCMEISNEAKRHIRTTGFMIHRDQLEKVDFPNDPITTRDECLLFEHRAYGAFYEQCLKLGLEVQQVTEDTKLAPLWDTHNRAHFKRDKEFYAEFR